ncbi:MAG: hypothetical protein JSW39_25470 [Desulfobacterales bacterium]|nr:MAG: hypothetical protein JSW39_25470 [Desulfobacterales bacterium]
MDRRYIVVFVLAVVAAGGFFMYRHWKSQKDLNVHNTRQYSRMIELAQKSPKAGLAQMGMALNKYREEKGAYPESLSTLYPDYVPVQAFIEELQWNYEVRGDDFYLSKTVADSRNNVMTAAIGADLRPTTESDIVVAAIQTPKHLPAKTTITPLRKKTETSITLAATTKSPLGAASSTAAPGQTYGQISSEERNASLKPVISEKESLHEFEPVSTKKLGEEEQFVQDVGEKFLVWKNQDGSLGFGNVQYPPSAAMTIYENGVWIQISRHRPKFKTASVAKEPHEEKTADLNRLVAAYSGQYLVWKDAKGNIGLGNVQYPHSRDIRIHVDGSWQTTIN